MLRTEQIYKFGASVDWTAIESDHSRDGQLPRPADVNSEVYLALIDACDARKAEALVLDRAADPLLLVRSLLFRGRLKESRHLIGNLKSREGGDRLNKVLTEEARLAAFNGDWKSCDRLCREAFAASASALTRLTLLQIGALAHFERGNFAKARFNLSLIDSMKTAFPKCISVFYAELLRLRLLAREGTAQASSVQAQIKVFWKKWLADPGDIDQLQALLRVEVDLRRVWNQPHFAFALASYQVAHAMGEDLYSALALVECHASAPASRREAFRLLALEFAPSFERVRRVFDELEGRRDPSTSVRAMKESLAELSGIEGPGARPVQFQEQVPTQLHAGSLVIPEYGVVVNLSPYRARSIAGYAQFVRVFEVLARGSVSKCEFFNQVWGNQKYVDHLHDSLIYTALYRIKKVCGIRATVRGGDVCLDDALVIA